MSNHSTLCGLQLILHPLTSPAQIALEFNAVITLTFYVRKKSIHKASQEMYLVFHNSLCSSIKLDVTPTPAYVNRLVEETLGSYPELEKPIPVSALVQLSSSGPVSLPETMRKLLLTVADI